MSETQAETQGPQRQPRRFPPLVLFAIFAVLLTLVWYGDYLVAWLGYRPGLSGDLPSATAFEATTLAGERIRMPEDYRGQLVLLNFWATWCGPCVAKVPKLREINDEFAPQGVVLLGVSLDYSGEEQRVRRFVTEHNLPWPQVYEGASAIANQYGVTGIPAMFLIDGDTGEIVAAGDQLNAAYLHGTLEDAVRAKFGAQAAQGSAAGTGSRS